MKSEERRERRRAALEAAAEGCAVLDALEEEAGALSRGAVVAMCSPGFRGRDRRQLRAAGHALDAVVQVGHQGLHLPLAEAIDTALERHELIKLRCLESSPCSIGAVALWVHRVTGAQVVQLLGRTLLAYRRHPQKPRIRLEGASESAAERS